MATPSGVLTPVHDLFNNPTLRTVLLKLRLPLSLAVAVALVLFINPAWFWAGIAVSAFGALFQLWCFSCIKTHKELAVNGPYMFIRNPMYVARFFLLLGLVLLTGNLWITGAYVVVYYLYMVNRVKREERKLKNTFGDPYREYCASLPRFFPTFKRYKGGRLFYFRWEFFQRQHGIVNGVSCLAFYAVCYVVTFHLRG